MYSWDGHKKSDNGEEEEEEVESLGAADGGSSGRLKDKE